MKSEASNETSSWNLIRSNWITAALSICTICFSQAPSHIEASVQCNDCNDTFFFADQRCLCLGLAQDWSKCLSGTSGSKPSKWRCFLHLNIANWFRSSLITIHWKCKTLIQQRLAYESSKNICCIIQSSQRFSNHSPPSYMRLSYFGCWMKKGLCEEETYKSRPAFERPNGPTVHDMDP